MAHSKTPWVVWGNPTENNPSAVVASKADNSFVFQTVGNNDEANAQFIIKAVNSYAAHINILRKIEAGMSSHAKEKDKFGVIKALREIEQ